MMKLGVCYENEEKKLGGKFENLNKLYKKEYNVPMALCLDADFLYAEIIKYVPNYEEYKNIFKEIESTAGCYLKEDFSKVESCIRGFKISEEGRKKILGFISEVFGAEERCKYAVRSSASHEDGIESSFAGVYLTTLNVREDNEIIESIEKAVIEYYSYPAIMTRVRNRVFTEKFELNIIVQRMVNAKISGVAFSCSPVSNNTPLVEWVYGYGEQLVSGEEEAYTYWKSKKDECDAKLVNVFDEVIENVQKIRKDLGYEVDVEWCYDGKRVYILQARAITDCFCKTKSTESIFEIDRLYLDANIQYSGKLNECKEIYDNYTKKRSRKYLLALSNQINIGRGYIIRFNYKGLCTNEKKVRELCEEKYFSKFNIDVNETIRQNIIEKDDLFQYMKNFFANANTLEEHTIIVREFISGTMGCISHCLEDGNVYIETSSDGLLAMNRGIATCESFFVDDENVEKIPMNAQCIQDIVKFTKNMYQTNHKYMIEWVICENKAFFIDFSEELNGGMGKFEPQKGKNKIIVPGNAYGCMYYLNAEEILMKLSISPGVSVNETNDILLKNPELNKIISTIADLPKKPIIFTEKPYAILTFLFDYVEGFVFKQGSLLCHLAIMLREEKKVAIISENFDEIVQKSEEIIISDSEIVICKYRENQNE